jgi:hypothetical protein
MAEETISNLVFQHRCEVAFNRYPTIGIAGLKKGIAGNVSD